MTPFRLSQLLGVLSLLQVVKCDFVRTSKSCYTVGEDIIVTFENDNPLVDDWVGFYAPNTPRNRLGNVPDSRWLWTCGSQSCSGRRPSGTLRFTATISAGNYRAYLARNGNSAPFQGLERSDRFEVRTSCGPGAPPPPGPAPPPPAPPGQQSITTDKRTYSAGETVVVRFRVSNPRNDDWIGIYPSTANQNNLRDGELWLRTCNRQGAACDGAVSLSPINTISWFEISPLCFFLISESRWHSAIWSWESCGRLGRHLAVGTWPMEGLSLEGRSGTLASCYPKFGL